MTVRRYTHHAINGEFITLDDLELFAQEMRTLRGVPGTAAVRFRGLFEINLESGPRAHTITVEYEPSADDLIAERPVKVGEATH